MSKTKLIAEESSSKIQLTNELVMALFIDADNISHTLMEQIHEEATKYGSVAMKRIYGDWNSPGMQGWREKIKDHALTPCQVFSNRKGKNATDSALIIDTMDVLHDGIIEGFCIVSNDSDFTRLAMTIKEHGKFVLGIGSKDSHASFRNACNVYVSTQNIDPESQDADKEKKESATSGKSSSERTSQKKMDAQLKEIRELLMKAYDIAEENNLTVNLSLLTSTILKLNPEFDSRTYGKKKMIELIEQQSDLFKIERRNDQTIMIIRIGEQ